MTPLPELNLGTLSLADWAFLDERDRGAPLIMCVHAAIQAYLWAEANRQPIVEGYKPTVTPSLADYRKVRDQ